MIVLPINKTSLFSKHQTSGSSSTSSFPWKVGMRSVRSPQQWPYEYVCFPKRNDHMNLTYSLLRHSRRRRSEFVSSPCFFRLSSSSCCFCFAASDSSTFDFKDSNWFCWYSIWHLSAAESAFSAWTSASSSCTLARTADVALFFGTVVSRPMFWRNFDDAKTYATASVAVFGSFPSSVGSATIACICS